MYKPYPGERVQLHGGWRLQGWQRDNRAPLGKLWSTRLPLDRIEEHDLVPPLSLLRDSMAPFTSTTCCLPAHTQT